MLVPKPEYLAAAFFVFLSSTLASSVNGPERRTSSGSSGSIPSNFAPSSNTQLSVVFQGQQVSPGEQLDINGTTESNLFTVIMIDPDAPTPQNPSAAQILHWMQNSLSATSNSSSTSQSISLRSSTSAQAAYLSPAPPAGSSAHRYIQYLFMQPSNFSIPAAFAGFGQGRNRTGFDVAKFAQAAQLGSPVAANFILVARSSNGTSSTGSNNSTGNPQPFKGGATIKEASHWSIGALLGVLVIMLGF
ncbi:MAG: hypothetical protein M1820_002859 [Bogoriella megaspora]|nr:MAG: hypothetical protein M1820_002859 [Bogoriella megaspora]